VTRRRASAGVYEDRERVTHHTPVHPTRPWCDRQNRKDLRGWQALESVR
jgi:hypothetical protein